MKFNVFIIDEDSLVNSILKAMKKYCLTFVMFFIGFSVFSQETVPEKPMFNCYTPAYENKLRQQHPQLSIAYFEKWMKLSRASVESRSMDELITIPIVFHILTDGEGDENLSEERIIEQVAQLNLDFSNQSNSPYSDAADIGIEFCLARYSPDNELLAEAGINRIYDYGDAPNEIFPQIEDVIKPATQWDPNKYMNVWVADFGIGFFGFSHPPEAVDSGLDGLEPDQTGVEIYADRDGILLSYEVVGSENMPSQFNSFYSMGKVLTHEVGHFFGLRHTWGNDISCGGDGDYCDDTPETTLSGVYCTDIMDTCPEDGLGNDMIENHMDLTEDLCKNTFTNDQKERMLTVLMYSPRRKELKSSTVCEVMVSSEDYTKGKDEIVVYPNPSKDRVTISYDPGRNYEHYQISNLLGRIVQAGSISSSSDLTVDIAHLESGMYLLQLTRKGKKTTSLKFIKK